MVSGSIRRRGKRSWQVQVELGRDPLTGGRLRRFMSVKGTRKDAERVLNEAIHERDTGISLVVEKLSVGEYLERWLRDYAEQNVAPATLQRYRQLMKRLAELLGGLKLSAIRPAHIQTAYSRLLEDGLAPRTVLHHHRVLRQALQQAVRWQLLIRNPADAVTPPRPERREMQTLSPAEVDVILAACVSDEQRRLVRFALTTGLRLGEILGLKWSDVDFESGRLVVQRTFQYLGRSQAHFRSPKTSKGRRSVALSERTVMLLCEQRLAQAVQREVLGDLWTANELVFAAADGQPARPYAVSSAFVRVARGAGFDGFRFHDLRHTAATLMLRAGIHPKIVSERLGHSTIAITLDTYSHVLPDMQRDAAEALDRVLNAP